MRFSIITPTHSRKNLPYLYELYDSLKEQTHSDWEWVLLLNGELSEGNLPRDIRNDTRVKVEQDVSGNTNIGYIKHRAFHIGTGDVLVEVDHDDLLARNCLEELEIAFQDEEIGFVYSDSITYRMDGSFVPHNPAHGWTYKEFSFRGNPCVSMNHFPPTSHSLSYIWYAPDHVRAWRTSLYRGIGGHNPELSVCDDHELCIRTYLASKMKFIPKPLYIYRITGDNTWLGERNQLIQDTTKHLFDTYSRLLAEKDADDQGLMKVDIGGGLFPYSDYKTVDLRDSADIVANLNDGIPLPDNSVGVLHAHHILEHLDDQQHIMAEIYRVLAPGGWAFIEVPSTDGRGAFQDPTHVTYWNQNSFLYWTNKNQAQFIDNTEIRFQAYKLKDYFPSQFMQDHNILVTCAVLVAIKDGCPRYPGELKI